MWCRLSLWSVESLHHFFNVVVNVNINIKYFTYIYNFNVLFYIFAQIYKNHLLFYLPRQFVCAIIIINLRGCDKRGKSSLPLLFGLLVQVLFISIKLAFPFPIPLMNCFFLSLREIYKAFFVLFLLLQFQPYSFLRPFCTPFRHMPPYSSVLFCPNCIFILQLIRWFANPLFNFFLPLSISY